MDGTSTWSHGPGLLESVWRYRWAVAVAAVVGGILGFVLSLVQPVVYQAEARLVLTNPGASSVFQEQGRGVTDPERHLAKEAERVMSRDVLELASESLDSGASVGDLRAALRTEEHPLVDSLVLVASGPTPEEAADVANAVGEAYQVVVRSEVQASAQAAVEELNAARADASARLADLQESLEANPGDTALQAEVEVARQQLVSISARAQQMAVEAAVYDSGVQTFEPAEPPLERSQPKPLRTTVVGMVLAMCAAGAFGWWRAEHNQVVEEGADVVDVLGAPLLGEVPVFRPQRGRQRERPLIGSLDPWSTEAYQFVVASLQFALEEVKGSSVAVTSVAQGDGKTITAMNVAFMAAQDGRRVILLDGDERVRGLTTSFGLQDQAGLSDIVVGSASLDECRKVHELPDASGPVHVIPAGTRVGEIAAFFRRPEFRKTMDELRAEADLLVVDTPPLLAVSDVLQIAGLADGVVVVVSRGTPVKELREAKERLAMVGTPIVGFVFNRAKGRQHASPYYSEYADSHKLRDREDGRPSPERPNPHHAVPRAPEVPAERTVARSTRKRERTRAREDDPSEPARTQVTHNSATRAATEARPVQEPMHQPPENAVAVPPPVPAPSGCPSPEEAALISCHGIEQPRIVAVEKYGDEARVLVDGMPSRYMVVRCQQRDGLWHGLPPYPLVG